VSKTCAEAFKESMTRAAEMSKRLYMLCSGECAARRYPEHEDHGKPRVGGYQHQKNLCWGGVSGPMAGQRVRGDASTAGGITLQHMDMTKLMMNDGMWSVIKWAIIWPG